MAGIALKSVKKAFGPVEVIHGIDLAVEEGEFCVFVGPSGCGKSTLLRMIAGLEDITEGEVAIDGERVNEFAASERRLAMVFQSYALYPHMTVAGNMGFALRMTGRSKAETRRRVQEAAETLQLTALLDRKPGQLSGGQRQRVAIGRAIVRNPRAFLFDEPLSNLDAELRVQMRVEIAKLHQDLGATMIYVTHDQIEAMTLADKIVVLRDGRIEQVGPPNALYSDPDNLFVAGFIGSPKMNFIEAAPAQGEDDDACLRLSDGTVVSSPVSARILQGHDTVLLGVRPEGFEPPSHEGEGLALSIDVVENLGGSAILHGKMSDGHVVLAEERHGPTVAPGDKAIFRFDPSRAFVFSRDGQRLRAR